MAVTVEMYHAGDPVVRSEVVAVIEHVCSPIGPETGVSIIGSQANDRWEMKITGEHRPEVIRAIVGKMVSARL
jgi:hypothetical protein